MRMSAMKVLVVDDQEQSGQPVTRGLSDQGWTAAWVQTAEAAQRAMGDDRYDVVVLDPRLPDRDGLDMLAEWRKYAINVPVLILSARSGVKDRVQGLERGADDYVAKPCSIEELMARVRALGRRQPGLIEPVLQYRDIVAKPATRTVAVSGAPVELTAREFSLLEIFIENAGRVVTRTLLIEKVWDMNYDVESNLLDVYMSRLRSKLEAASGKAHIETIRGMGYKLV